MNKIVSELKTGEIMISDGAWGTFLQQKGLKVGDCPEFWNITNREDVLDIAESYVKAGADMIESNSFGGSRIKLDYYGLGEQTARINETAAVISRKAAGDDRHVIASIGPTGKMLITGDVTEEQLYDVFKEQSMALEKGGADAACIETMSALDEAVIAVKAVKENTGLEILASFTFEQKDRKYYTMMGITPENIVKDLINAGADIIGTNCGNGIAGMIGIVAEIRRINMNIPVIVQANAGLPEVVGGRIIYRETPEIMASYIPQLIEAGTNIIGGCCGTTPEHIKKIKEAVLRFING